MKRVCVTKISHHLFSDHVTLGLREKTFNRVFYLEKTIEKHGFLGRFFLSRFVFLHLKPSRHLQEPCSSETAFANSG